MADGKSSRSPERARRPAGILPVLVPQSNKAGPSVPPMSCEKAAHLLCVLPPSTEPIVVANRNCN